MLRLRNISLKFGLFPLMENVNLVIQPNDKIALVGRNGTGKSTLFKLITGLQKPDSGVIECDSAIKISMLEQEFTSEIADLTIFEIVAKGLGEAGDLMIKYHNLLQKASHGCNKSLEKMQKVQDQIDQQNAWGAQNQIENILSKLELDGELIFSSLSGGRKRRVLLAKALVVQPDLLLLDEPTNHLDIEGIKWLENLLINWKTSLLFISHDRAFVRKVATRIVELDRAVLLDWPGNYENFLRKKEEYLNAQELEFARFDKKLADEEVWIRQGIKARRTRNEGRVRALKKLREQRAKRQPVKGNIRASIQAGEKSGHQVIVAENISKSFDNKAVIRNFSTVIMRGDKIGIIGPNGAGKTTLISILLEQLKPDTGTVEHGTKLEIAYFDQFRAILDEKLSVRDNVSGGSNTVTVNGKDKHVIGYLQDFLFTPERANGPITALSGGERNRLLLAKLFTKPSNLLILDEPTNDLDIETLELLEDLLVNYSGTILLISHDREFINNVVTSTIVFEGDGFVQEYFGDYDDWLAQSANVIKKSISVKKPEVKKPEVKKPEVKKPEVKTNTSTNTNPDVNSKELKLLLAQIEELEQESNQLQQQTLAPGFYQQDKAITDPVTGKLVQIKKELEQLYKRWDEL